MKKMCIILLLLSISGMLCFSEDITGLYIEDEYAREPYYGCSAIKITALSEDEYFIQRVFITDEHTHPLWRGQASYAKKKEGESSFYFYWHTGRYDDIPGSDSIIVYEITSITEERLDGFYFFPSSKAGGKAAIRFPKFQKKE